MREYCSVISFVCHENSLSEAALGLTACKRSAACGHRTPLGETASEMPYILHTEEYVKPSRQFGLPKAVSLDKVGGSAQKTNKFVLSCPRLALSFHKIGGGSAQKTNKFVLFCSRLALSFDKIGGGSAQKTNKFVLFCSRLALSLLQTGCISA